MTEKTEKTEEIVQGLESQVAVVIKYAPITNFKMKATEKKTSFDPTKQILTNYIMHV